MITNFSLNDNTQNEILKHLEITSKLLSKVGTKLSETQKEILVHAKIVEDIIYNTQAKKFIVNCLMQMEVQLVNHMLPVKLMIIR